LLTAIATGAIAPGASSAGHAVSDDEGVAAAGGRNPAALIGVSVGLVAAAIGLFVLSGHMKANKQKKENVENGGEDKITGENPYNRENMGAKEKSSTGEKSTRVEKRAIKVVI
jgi:hypothetical protein